MRRQITLGIAVIVAGVWMTTALAQRRDEKHVYVTALDASGTPIAGLTAEHFAIMESGRERTVLAVEPLRTPMHVAVLVDTSMANGAPDENVRSAIVSFVVRLASDHRVALYGFGDRAVRMSEFVQDTAALRTAATGLFGSGHQRSHLIDAVDLALRDLEKIESPRPVIVVIASESPEASGITAGGVIKRLIAQSVAFHAISVATATGSTQAAVVSSDIPAKSQRLGGMSAAGEGDRERTQMLRQGTSSTGGGLQRVTNTLALGPALARFANEAANSYRVTFARPGAAKMRDLRVGLLVEGVTLRATAAPFGTR